MSLRVVYPFDGSKPLESYVAIPSKLFIAGMIAPSWLADCLHHRLDRANKVVEGCGTIGQRSGKMADSKGLRAHESAKAPRLTRLTAMRGALD